ncbi:HAD family phosphatase [Pectobacteriaceae bacterium CE70]|nr:HAD family phosphatase [Pectobacteriaceae bacterium C52]WJV68464.1 HAD family phosphatase [Pectobacteriaceae bacterium CE70]WJY12394.1 HAD family phosphatase [Pectobacteriaceae bacterium C80]
MSESVERVAAVLFDMDGVLIDSRAVIEQGWCEAAKMYGRQITEEDIMQHIHGQPGPHTIRALFHDLSLSDQAKVQAHIIHVENTADCEPIPGVAQLIASLGAAGIPLGIVTSGWRLKIDRVIALLQAQPYISVIVERDDVTRGKPYPDPYLLAAERLGLPASKTVVFEDAKSGVTSAVAAGAYCVGIGDEDLLPCGAKFILPDFRDMKVLTNGADGAILSFCSEHKVIVERLSAHQDRQPALRGHS